MSFSRPSRFTLLFPFLLTLLLFGCGVTANPEKRKPIEILSLKSNSSEDARKIVVRFEESLPGKPLPETVWDNVTGPFWDVKESRQIGYTQNYAKLISSVAAGTVVGGVAGGMVVGAAAGPKLVETRIVIPFGRIFSETVQSAVKASFPNSVFCFDDTCEYNSIQELQPEFILKMKVNTFQVWEEPTNHINLNVSIVAKVHMPARPNQPELSFEKNKKVAAQSVGSVMTTSSGFISEMNRICNEFAKGLSVEIIDAGLINANKR